MVPRGIFSPLALHIEGRGEDFLWCFVLILFSKILFFAGYQEESSPSGLQIEGRGEWKEFNSEFPKDWQRDIHPGPANIQHIKPSAKFSNYLKNLYKWIFIIQPMWLCYEGRLNLTFNGEFWKVTNFMPAPTICGPKCPFIFSILIFCCGRNGKNAPKRQKLTFWKRETLNSNVFRINTTIQMDPLLYFLCFFVAKKSFSLQWVLHTSPTTR